MKSKINAFSEILKKNLAADYCEIIDQSDDEDNLLTAAFSVRDPALMGRIVSEFNGRVSDEFSSEEDDEDDTLADLDNIRPVYLNKALVRDIANTKSMMATSIAASVFETTIRSISNTQNLHYELLLHKFSDAENEIEFFTENSTEKTGRVSLLRILIQSTRGEATKITLSPYCSTKNTVALAFSYQSPENIVIKKINEALSRISHMKSVLAASQKASARILKSLRQIDSIPQYAVGEARLISSLQPSKRIRASESKKPRLIRNENSTKQENSSESAGTSSNSRNNSKFSATAY